MCAAARPSAYLQSIPLRWVIATLAAAGAIECAAAHNINGIGCVSNHMCCTRHSSGTLACSAPFASFQWLDRGCSAVASAVHATARNAGVSRPRASLQLLVLLSVRVRAENHGRISPATKIGRKKIAACTPPPPSDFGARRIERNADCWVRVPQSGQHSRFMVHTWASRDRSP